MPSSHFTFLQAEWPELYEAACKVEKFALADPQTACFYARRSLEMAVHWLYKHDAALKLPYNDQLSALIHEPSFRNTVGNAIVAKAMVIKDLGNQAVHGRKRILQYDGLVVTKELFHFCFWLARTYARGAKPEDALVFNQDLLPKTSPAPVQSQAQLQELEAQLRERDEKLESVLTSNASLDEELQRLRAEIAEAKKANTAHPDEHDYSEAETRDYFIDLLLKEAGWPLDQKRDREFPVTGMPNNQGQGFVDYVLWGDDGKPLGIVEAKRTKKSAQIGQQQAKLYAECLETQFGQRPIIFYTNGYDHWLWDDACYPPRPVQGFYKKAELELLIQRRASRKKLAAALIDDQIVERFYQTRAIRRISEAFERDLDRKALVVMATGAGKTRTVIALCDVLMRCNWAKRILFLADRVALVTQAVNAFKNFLPQSSPVNLVTEKSAQGRVYVSTYPTMLRQIDELVSEQRLFGVGHFDLVIIDEAHRSVYQKYGAIFKYFDSLLVGLTATPKEDVDHNTYSLFDLQKGVPTDAYTLEDAVKDGYLVPPQAVSVPLKFQREGIKYDDLSEEEKAEWDEKEWGEEGEVPNRVEAEAVNKWLFNEDTVDKVLEHLMSRGQRVESGNRLGKTIIFAKNQKHAEFIAKRFDKNYPHHKGEFARVIHCGLPYAQSLIDDFSQSSKPPHIAISVDMLDTGIDIPEVLNLVFFKLVRSKTKFWQMVGRGTRLCPDVFGPDQDKTFFYIFDYCQNLEYFSQNPATTDGASGASLDKRLFCTRLDLISTVDKQIATIDRERMKELLVADGEDQLLLLRQEMASLLQEEVAGMRLENFIVRPQRRLVEKYCQKDTWLELNEEALGELAHKVAGLPSEIETDDEDAKRFDLLMLNLQLALLRSEPGFTRLRDQVKAIAGLLEEKASIPMVQAQLPLIQEVQDDEWWENITVSLLDKVRKGLRLLVKLIEKKARKPIYTDFEDLMGAEISHQLPGFAAPDTYDRFRAKARHFLKEHESQPAIRKLRNNEPLEASDLSVLEQILIEGSVGTAGDLEKAKTESCGLGLFVRSLVGLDRQAAKKAMDAFLVVGHYQANQIQFIDEIINHLTEHGCMAASRLYESPFTDFNPRGVEGVFDTQDVDKLISILDDVRNRAIA